MNICTASLPLWTIIPKQTYFYLQYWGQDKIGKEIIIEWKIQCIYDSCWFANLSWIINLAYKYAVDAYFHVGFGQIFVVRVE